MILMGQARGVLGTAGAGDSLFASVTYLWHLDGTNGQTGTYANNGSGAASLSSNSGSLSTASFKFGTASLRATTSGRAATAANAAISGTGDFTYELWFNPDSVGTTGSLIDTRTNSIEVALLVSRLATGALRININNVTHDSAASALTAATWQHVAVCRASGTIRAFIDGTQVISFADLSNFLTSRPIAIGAAFNDGNASNAYFDEVRVTTAARYAAGFTAPTTAFPNHG